MFLSKIKFATAAVLTTGMIGAGVGWVAVPGNGSGIVGEAHADDRANRERDEALRQRQMAEQARAQAEAAKAAEMQARDLAAKAHAELRAAQARLDQAMAQVQMLEKRQADTAKTDDRNRDERLLLERQLTDLKKAHLDRDQQRADEAFSLRSRLAQEEERFKALDREENIQVEWLMKAMTEGRTGIENQKKHLARLLETHGADHPDVAREKRALDVGSETLDRLHAELKQRQAKMLKDRMQAREMMVRLEEEAKRVERRAALEERDIADKRAAIQDRLRQASGGNAPAEHRLHDIERKLDALARELAELRREIKK